MERFSNWFGLCVLFGAGVLAASGCSPDHRFGDGKTGSAGDSDSSGGSGDGNATTTGGGAAGAAAGASSDNEAGAATAGDGPVGECEPGAPSLSCADETKPIVCNEQGDWVPSSIACSGTEPFCLKGSCVACQPNSMPTMCINETPQFCAPNGEWQAASACPDKAPTCSNGNCVCKATTCGSACVDLTSNAKNCGDCGHSCQGGVCVDAKCKPLALIEAQGSPFRTAVNSTSIFWTTKKPCKIMKANLDGSGAVPLYDGGCYYGLAADDTNVYFVSGDQMGVVSKVPVAGGASTVIATKAFFPYDISADAKNVYYAAYEGGVGYVSKDTWTQKALTTEYGPRATASGNQSIYYINRDLGNIRRMFLSDTQPTNVTTQTLVSTEIPHQLAAIDTTIWYTTGGEVRQVSAFGGTPTVLAAQQSNADSIAVDASGVYWANST